MTKTRDAQSTMKGIVMTFFPLFQMTWDEYFYWWWKLPIRAVLLRKTFLGGSLFTITSTMKYKKCKTSSKTVNHWLSSSEHQCAKSHSTSKWKITKTNMTVNIIFLAFTTHFFNASISTFPYDTYSIFPNSLMILIPSI